MIDIVVRYVNEKAPGWWETREFYREKEGVPPLPPSRARDYGTLKYIFRGIETNCEWVNKVILLLDDETQTPDWLDLANPKLRVVYHNEFIPLEFLPTYNSMVIGAYIPLIKGLANNYIVIDDDMFFLKKIDRDRYFVDNYPVLTDKLVDGPSYLEGYGPGWGCNLDNGLVLERVYGELDKIYFPPHFPQGRDKFEDRDVLERFEDLIYASLAVSRFRHPANIDAMEMYANICRRQGLCEFSDRVVKGCWYTHIEDGEDFDKFDDADIVCFNDNEILNPERMGENMRTFLERKLPNKSSFER